MSRMTQSHDDPITMEWINYVYESTVHENCVTIRISTDVVVETWFGCHADDDVRVTIRDTLSGESVALDKGFRTRGSFRVLIEALT